MPFDGVVTRSIVNELSVKLINGRIDKITQPEPDEIVMIIRNNGENYKLLLTSSSIYPRVHLTNISKQSPINAPMFCMVLRKHISGGRIVKIEQYNLDRIIKLYVESYDELGNLSNKIVICEIMGRHSNIILVNEGSNTVVDSIKHITPDISSFRQVMPGLTYSYPPMQDKLEPLQFNAGEFEKRIDIFESNVKIEKFIMNTMNGFSILSAREICYNAGINPDTDVLSLTAQHKQSLYATLALFTSKIKGNNFVPTLYYNGIELFDFYCLELGYLKDMKSEKRTSISDTIETFYFKKDKTDRLRQRSSDILKLINTNIDRCLKKLSIQEEKLLECSEKDKWKIYGDLIMSNLYNIQKGDTKARLQNYYDENESYIEIQLDMTLTPAQNAQKYYNKYNKDKNAEQIVVQQKEENLEEIEYLESQLVSINNCTDDIEIEEIRNELITMGYIKKSRKTASKKPVQSKPLHYISSQGFDIYVGKNNFQNDYLTTKFADPWDIWFHTKKIPGSHVIIKTNSKPVDDTTIFEAANLAANYSKAKNSANIPVDYTEKRNVKKPSGAKPGMVIYYTNKTLYITPDEELLSKLKNMK